MARPVVVALFVLALSPALASCGARGEGTLSVVSFPRGRLVLDGRTTNEPTPLTGRRIRAGEHRISVVADGVRFEPQTVTVRDGRTTHLYFRARDPSANLSSREICQRGRPDHCIARIEDALRANETAEAKALTQLALAADPHEGYGILLRRILTRLGGDAGPEPYPDE